MPESPLEKKAEEYLRKKEEFENQRGELIKEFIKSVKTSIKISGYSIKYRHKETNQIIVKTED
jgi:hypothetical protein